MITSTPWGARARRKVSKKVLSLSIRRTCRSAMRRESFRSPHHGNRSTVDVSRVERGGARAERLLEAERGGGQGDQLILVQVGDVRVPDAALDEEDDAVAALGVDEELVAAD